jgi:hypothetical protein
MRRRSQSPLPLSARRFRAKNTETGMFHKTAIVLAITLVIGSFSTARAEDPDEDMVGRFHVARHDWPAETFHHAVPFSEPQRPHHAN